MSAWIKLFGVASNGAAYKFSSYLCTGIASGAHEQAAGIGSLSHLERKVLRAAFAASNSENIFSPIEVLEMLRGEDGMSRSSFFRSLKALCAGGYVTRLGTDKRAGYEILLPD